MPKAVCSTTMLRKRFATIARVQEITSGDADSLLECVGSKSAMAIAIGIARPSRVIEIVSAAARRQRTQFQSGASVHE